MYLTNPPAARQKLCPTVADGDGGGVGCQCSVLVPSFHLGGDCHHEPLQRPVGDHLHHPAPEVRLQALRHDQLHSAVRGATCCHDGLVLSHRGDPVAQQPWAGATVPEQRRRLQVSPGYSAPPSHPPI